MSRSCAPCGVDQPCWPTPDPALFCPPCLDLTVEADQMAWDTAWASAVSYVYDCTCRRWPGKCWAEIVRPCTPACGCPVSARDCRCGRWEALNLCNAFCMPTCEILGIIVNGEIWDQPWRLEHSHYSAPCMPGADCGPFLVVEDCGWLPVQNLNRPLGEECTWAIIARTGCEPPAYVLREVSKLAIEILKNDPSSCLYDPDNCALPDGVTQMSRKGMTVQFDRDRTGLPILDKAIKQWECCEADNEGAGDPSADTTFHVQWAGHIDSINDGLASLMADPPELPEPVAAPYSSMVIPGG